MVRTFYDQKPPAKKSESKNRGSGTKKNGQEKQEKQDRQDRQERQDRQDRQEKQDRQERQDRQEKQERQDRQDRKERQQPAIDEVDIYELHRTEKDELLDVIHDVDNFLHRRDGLPQYISRLHLIQELCKALTATNIDIEIKVEVTDMMWLLVNQSNSISEVTSCIDLSLPIIVSQLGSSSAERQQAAIRFLQRTLEEPPNRHQVVSNLARNGINRKNTNVSLETMKILPGLYLPYMEEMNIEPVIIALYEELSQWNKEGHAFAALLRHRDMLGPEAFDDLSDAASIPDKRKFKQLMSTGENGVGDNEYYKTKRPKDGVSFGLIPNLIVNRSVDKTNRHERTEGSVLLKKTILKNKDDLSLLLPYLASFVKYLGNLLLDSCPKVVIQSLECHMILLTTVPSVMEQHTEQVCNNIMKVSLDSKSLVKAELYNTVREVMMCSGPGYVVDLLLQNLQNKTPKVREDALIYVIFALLTFPSDEFDSELLSQRIAPAIADPKRRVRQASLECFAVIDANNGPSKADILYESIDNAELSDYDDKEVVKEALYHRLSRKTLPKITDTGFVEYGLIIPHNHYAKSIYTKGGRKSRHADVLEGADVEWILRGTGGLSKGTSTNLLGLRNGDVMGSSVSLQSLRSNTSMSSNRSRSRERLSSRSDFSSKSRIPDIGSNSRRTRSASPPRRGRDPPRRNNDVKDDLFDTEFPANSEEQALKDKYNKRRAKEIAFQVTKYDGTDNLEDDEIKTHWRHDQRSLSEVELQKRSETYDKNSKFQSMLDLRAQENTPPEHKSKLNDIQEEQSEFKSKSLKALGLHKGNYKTIFDDEEGKDDKDIPGGFKHPDEAYSMAKHDIKSDEWQVVVDGLDAIVRLLHYHPRIISSDMKYLIGAVNSCCKNLRSQVSRAALQTMIHIFVEMGRKCEIKTLDQVAEMLLTKVASSNKFIMKNARCALTALSESISIHRFVVVISDVGLKSKNAVSRAFVAKLLSELVGKVGHERFMRVCEEDTLEVLLNAAVQFLNDGSNETRSHIKAMIEELRKDPEFDHILEDIVDSKNLDKVRKSLNRSS